LNISLDQETLNVHSLSSLQVLNQGLSEKIYSFFNKLNKLDLHPVAKKLIFCDNATGRTLQQTEYAISLYKMFLCLHFLFPDIELVPTKEIDEVWHTHILLNTYKYIQDCQDLYGYIFHHYSPVNETLEFKYQHYKKAIVITKYLFEKLFGVSVLEDSKYPRAACLIVPLDNHSLQISACLTLPKIQS
jgi:hypothetical protein